ncbi:hypothetical protein NQZ68_019069 [Dissostichus eleginoides]|nr:hypothetical protein NQZ68_019069 [Dissostichus eleginoides]
MAQASFCWAQTLDQALSSHVLPYWALGISYLGHPRQDLDPYNQDHHLLDLSKAREMAYFVFLVWALAHYFQGHSIPFEDLA